MARKWQLLVEARGDAGSAVAAMRELRAGTISAGEAAETVSKRMKSMGRRMRMVGRDLSMKLTLPIAAAGAAAVKMAADAEETANKMGVVFGGNVGKLNRRLDDFAAATGASRYAMREQAATIGALVKGMGLTSAATADMSLKTVQLAKDFSSFHNVAEDDALEALRSGLTGEAEPLKQFGILVDEATVKTVAYAEGIAEQGAELTQAEKLQARYLAIMKQASKQGAVGDATRTAGSLSNQLKTLQNRARDIAITFGKDLIPVAQDVVGWFAKMADKFAALTPKQRKWIIAAAGIAAALGPTLIALGTLATTIGVLISPVGAITVGVVALTAAFVTLWKRSDRFRKAMKLLWKVMSANPLVAMAKDIVRLVREMRQARTWTERLRAVLRFLGRAIQMIPLVWLAKQLGGNVGKAFRKVQGAAGALAGFLRGALKQAILNMPLVWITRKLYELAMRFETTRNHIDLMKNAAITAGAWMQSTFNRVISIIDRLISKAKRAGSAISGIKPWKGALPGFASGGIVRGPMVATVGEEGPEAIIPLGGSMRASRDRARVMRQAGLGGGGSGITIHQHFRGEPDPFVAARRVKSSLQAVGVR